MFERYRRAGVSRDQLAWLIDVARLPVLVKGVLHADDARACRELGAAGLVVSNHGGRTLDGVCASLDVLPGIRAALGTGFTLLFDGGIRAGEDVLKALAADAIMPGRLQVYALAVAGALGVAHMLRLVRQELGLHMVVTGCATLDDVRHAAPVRHTRGATPRSLPSGRCSTRWKWTTYGPCSWRPHGRTAGRAPAASPVA